MRKQKKKILFQIILLAGMLSISACSKKTEVAETTRAFFGTTGTTGWASITDNGILKHYIQNGSPFLKYIDFATGQEVFLCATEGCAHTGSSCSASLLPIGGEKAFFYQGALYLIGQGEGMNAHSVWKASVDGSGKKELTDCIPGNYMSDLCLIDNMLYYVDTYYEETTPGEYVMTMDSYGILAALNLDTLETEILDTTKGSFHGGYSYLTALDGCVYFEKNAFSQDLSSLFSGSGLTSEETEALKQSVTVSRQYICYDPKENDLKPVYETETSFYETCGAVGFDPELGVLLLDWENRLIWAKNGEEKVLWEWESSDCKDIWAFQLIDDYAMMMDEEDWLRLIDRNTGALVVKAELPVDEKTGERHSYQGYYDGKIYFSIDPEPYKDTMYLEVEELADKKVIWHNAVWAEEEP
ncbi:MAG: hypothetical protein IJ468_04545 [Lachnospiraceae bacterium]|nr:hypothetical protein [Lachnospiraceae bacterium]